MRAAFLAAVLILSAIAAVAPQPVHAQDPSLVLKVGVREEMKTRNILPPIANDVFTLDVLTRVYDRPLKSLPGGTLVAYVAKGVDLDEDGTFEASEYNAWSEQSGAATPLDVAVYYDFNGVRWHDGDQMTVWDLLFSYHLAAIHGRLNTSLRVLFQAGPAASYDDGGRGIDVSLAAKDWEGEGAMVGNPALRVALRFRMSEPYARFFEKTLAPLLFPMHVWSRTGGGTHGDFGCAIWIPPAEASAKGIPECGNANPGTWGRGIASSEAVPGSTPYQYVAAEQWNLRDSDVVGSGPFSFYGWIPGVQAAVVRNERYYTGVDPNNPSAVYDARLAAILRKPVIEGIRFLVYRTTQLGVFALQNSEIDFYRWNVGAEFAPDLLKVPEVAVVKAAETGFAVVGYNLRTAPFGYDGNDPAKDVGYWLRKAIAHLVDKKSIVQNRLQNFGVVLDGFISPGNPSWYDPNVPAVEYNVTRARDILGSPGALAAGIGPDPPGACGKDTPSGCRALPGIGTSAFEILRPAADFEYGWDPLSMIGDSLRQVGLNALTVPTSPGEVLRRLQAHTFDMYAIGWSLGDHDPAYLFDLFHSSNAVAGANYGGFQNATFDATIESSLRELNRTTRGGLTHQAHLVLLDARPAEPIYARTNVEAYREDRFVNWTVMDGTIWNEWSLLRIRSPPSETLRLSLVAPSAMDANVSELVTIAILDERGVAVAGATASVTVTAGALSLDGVTAMTVTGLTGADGRLVATYRSPDVQQATDVLLTANATHWDFRGTASRTAAIRVFPAGVSYLSVIVDLPLGDLLRPGGTLPMAVGVRDQDGFEVLDASVTVTGSHPSTVWAIPSNGTAADLAVLSVRANESIAEAGTFNLTVGAAKAGHEGTNRTLSFTVIPETTTFRCPSGELVTDLSACPETRGPDAGSVYVAIGFAAGIPAVAGTAILWRRRRQR